MSRLLILLLLGAAGAQKKITQDQLRKIAEKRPDLDREWEPNKNQILH